MCGVLGAIPVTFGAIPVLLFSGLVRSMGFLTIGFTLVLLGCLIVPIWRNWSSFEAEQVRKVLLDIPCQSGENQDYSTWLNGDVDALIRDLSRDERRLLLGQADGRRLGPHVDLCLTGGSVIGVGEWHIKSKHLEIHRLSDTRFYWRRYESERLD